MFQYSLQRKKGGGFQKGFFAKMYASLGCGALSAKCTAGSKILGYFLGFFSVTLERKRTLLKPPFLRSGQTSVLQTSFLEMLQCPPRSDFSLDFATWRNKYFDKAGGFAVKPRSTWSRSASGLSWFSWPVIVMGTTTQASKWLYSKCFRGLSSCTH